MTPNTSNLLPSNDYGLKISKPFADVNNAQDNDLLFNSAWPSIQIVKSVIVSDTTPISHGLSYPTFAVQQFSSGLFQPIDTDTTLVYPRFGGGLVVIYNIDITTDVDYPFSDRRQVRTTYDPNYGFKIVKPTRNIDSTDLRDFLVHSRAGSPLVLAVKTQASVHPDNPTSIVYESVLEYPVFVFGYVQNTDGKYLVAPQGGQAYPAVFTDGTLSTLALQTAGVYNGKASLIVLRSPMFASTFVEVVYP